LGAMQLHWEPSWINWHSKNLYKCNGSSIGAHAVGLRCDVFPALLDACRKRDLPFDIGALHVVKRQYRDRSFTFFPNLVIQDATDTEIGTSTIFFREARQETNIYRWQISHYGLDAIKAQLNREDTRRNGRVTIPSSLRRLRALLSVKKPIRAPRLASTSPRGKSSTSTITPLVRGQVSGLNEPRLVPFDGERPNARVVLVLVIDVVREQLPRLL